MSDFKPLGAQSATRAHSRSLHGLTPSDGVLEASAWYQKPIPSRKWCVDGVIPRHEVTQISGDGGGGKSIITLQLLVAATAGGDWLGHKVPNMRVLGVYCEDDEDELHRRTAGILHGEGLDFSDCDGLTLTCRKGRESILFEANYNDMEGSTTAFYDRLRHTAMELGAEIIILDSLYNFFAGNENNRGHANQFVNALCQMAQAIGGAVVLVSHPSLSGMASGSGTAGNTAWHNAVRSRLYLHREKTNNPDDIGELVLEDMKQNYGPKNGKMKLRYDSGRFINVTQEDFDTTPFSERTGGMS